MKTLYESLLDDDLIDQIDDKVDFYKRTIQCVKDSGKNFHPHNIYNIMVETTWANRDWKQCVPHFCKQYFMDPNEFVKDRKSVV